MRNRYPQNIVEAFANAAIPGLRRKTFMKCHLQRITYGELCTVIAKLYTLYNQWGLQPGDCVAISTENDIHAAALFLSLLRAGITAVFIDPDTRPSRVEHLLAVVRPKAIILDKNLQEKWQNNAVDRILVIEDRKTSNLLHRLLGRKPAQEVDDRAASYPAILQQLSETTLPGHVDPDVDAYVLFTSGTTSNPKGVRISHRALFAHLQTLSRQFGYTPETRLLNILILSHADGMIQGPVIAFYNTACLYRPMTFSIQKVPELLDAIYHYRITHFVAVPTMLSLIEKFAEAEHDAFQTEDFIFIISCGAQLEAELWHRFEEKFQVRLVNVYGLTETVIGGFFSGPDSASHEIGTIGMPVDCKARLVDEKDQDVKPGASGELLLKGENLTSGYLNAPDATADVFLNGWFRTGDVAIRDEKGLFRIIGRKKSVIISGGINVHPEEVTEALHKCPLVQEAVTLGLTDSIWGERVVSAVVPVQAQVDESEIIASCREHLEETKMPKKIFFLSQLPRGRSGKVQLERIRELIEEQVTDASAIEENINRSVINLAAQCFKMSAESLDLGSTTNSAVGWDSIAHLEFVVMLERKFDVCFEPHEIMQVNSLGDACKIISSKQNDLT
jgi:long-chain acyl-CoA synthetase